MLLPEVVRAAPPRFANFAAAANRAAFDAVVALAAGVAAKPTVYLWGDAGAGKTHLLRAAVFAAAGAARMTESERLPHSDAPAASHTSAASRTPPQSPPLCGGEVKRGQSPQSPQSPDGGADGRRDDNQSPFDGGDQRASFYLAGGDAPPPPQAGALLAADDIHKFPPACERDLYRWLESGRVAAAGVCAPPDLPLPPPLRSRLGGGLVFRLRAAGEADLRLALSDYAARKGFHLEREVTDLLITRLPRALAQLLAAVDDLDRFALGAGRPLNVKLARDWLRRWEDG